jgi:DNA repair protein SbcC/Rad50
LRILAIRGRNLASLAGDFEVDLEAPPLCDVGLFAISGPTGAGKTTLLDALCLALFDRTPRLSQLSQRGAVKVGLPSEDDALWMAAHDVRSLLRKGASSGFAEVDFLGRDGGRYRARWAVRRARDRPDGKAQLQSVTLCSLEATDQLIGRTKEEVLGHIERRLGLSFEQFRRSALLAQGEFAAFLRADERERAELLEQMTGTWVYGELSIRAHERSRAEARALEELSARAREVTVLGPPERAALELAASQGEHLVAERHRRLLEAEAARAYFRALAHLVEQERAAQAALVASSEAFAAAEGRRAELARIAAAQALRGALSRWDEARESAAQGEQERRDLEAAEAAAAAAALAARSRRSAAEARLDEVRVEVAASQGELERAAALDGDVRVAATLLADAEREADEAAVAASAARARAEAAAASLTMAAAERDAAGVELARRAHLAPLAAGWESARLGLRRYVELAREVERVNRPGAEARAAAAAEQAAAAAAAAETAASALAEALARDAEAEAAAAAYDVPRLREQRERLLARGEALAALAAAADEVRVSMRDHAAALDAAEQAREGAAIEATRAAALARRRAETEAVLGDAEAALQHSRAAQDLEAHRAALAEGAECPLCGSLEHPWRSGARAFSALVGQHEERVAYLRQFRGQLAIDEATSRASERERHERARAEASRAAQLAAQRSAIEARWAALRAQGPAAPGEGETVLDAAGPPSAPEPALPERAADDAAPGAVRAARAALAASLGALRTAERAADACAVAARATRAALEGARREAERRGSDRITADAAAASASEALARADLDIEKARMGQGGVLEEIAVVFDACEELRVGEARDGGGEPWRVRVARDCTAFGVSCLDEVTQYRALAAAAESASALLATLAPAREAATSRAAELGQIAEARRAQVEARASGLRALRAARAGVFGGRSTEQVSEALSQALDAAEREARASGAASDASALAAALARAALVAAADRQRERGEALAHADAALSAALAAAGLSVDSLRKHLAFDAAWARGEAAALEALGAAVARADAVLAERSARRAEHEAQGQPAATADEVEAAIEGAGAALAQAEESLTVLRVRLRDDDRERGRAAQIAEQVGLQRAQAERWGSLAQLIGSADGKKFRVFAQSLTFDALIALANVHLSDLARRYQLMRVPRTDLDLQVIDREMADEARSVSSLSGGETFLVSLALALGLSSLGSRDTRVETLFIDEGFGTLDPESLDIALSALDALQDAGRQVGLISHVPGLAERLGAQVRVLPRGAGRSVVVVER